jgi:hypothetical protein
MKLIEWITEELILSGTHECTYYYARDVQLLISTIWILNTVWEILALFLSIWVTIKHLREMRLLRVGSTVEDYFTVLAKSHALYFARCVHNVTVVMIVFLKFCMC